MELMKNKSAYKDQLTDEGHPDLPKTVEDVDRVNLGNVVSASQVKLFPKLVKAFEKDTGLKMRRINKN